MSELVRVVLIDDHPLFREGVAVTLGVDSAWKIVAEGESADDALRLALAHLPDVMLLDLHIPGGGLNALKAVVAACPVTRVVMLTVSEDEAHVLAALKAGARGYLLKGVSGEELRRVVRAVQAGEAYVTPSLAASMLHELTRETRPTSPLDELTPRERQILEGVAAGRSNKEIARDLDLTEKTVKHYMTNVLQKLQVRNRVEAALLAQKAARKE
ncbi:LuxR C-terminal-related transcriptional regulator [Deinococcus yavapaiensis]|uniref:LuxR family two component transcriptional regulator n=1 Tax=Deinococcus yavapaiensis KR-236 TaxID=694435 RepID=A0A318SBY4_9DEIO|nr:response regulator transcription factor [Deinococcus yavapaiensis]PYE56331.1 LuxR family two component transcriptional regulator [Deinococcus yavapaiensis KR-236]